MDYTNNVFVHESNYKGNTNREVISNFDSLIKFREEIKLERR